MAKITELFKENEGMAVEGSTVEQRHEIWELLFKNKLIYNQDENLENESFALGNREFYFCNHNKKFIVGFIFCCENNIPFEEFKARLSQYND